MGRALFIVLVFLFANAPARAESCVHEIAGADGVPILARPIDGSVSRAFGLQYDEVRKMKTQHDGVDLDAPLGETVYAAGTGKVVQAGPRGDLGAFIRIDHGNGLSSGYGHLGEITVQLGACVKGGHEIAKSGASGVTPLPQLHFEVLRDGKPVDPLEYLK